MPKDKKQLTPEEAAAKKATVLKLILLIAVTAVIFVIYRVLLTSSIFPYVLATYLVVFTALIVFYLIYNRGFAGKDATPDMLPSTMTYEEKLDFIEKSKQFHC